MEPRVIKSIYLLPIIMGVELMFGMIICFLIALSKGDVSAYIPFISETGAKPPESGILGLFLVIGAFLGILVMSTRFLIVSELNSGHLKKIDIINVFSVIVGYLSLGGMIVVAVYPMSTIMTAHMAGAMTLFFGGLAYGLLQCLITYWMHPTHNGIAIFRIRLAICVCCLSFLILNSVFMSIGQRLWEAQKEIIAEKTPQDKGFAEILTASTSEWLMGFSFLIFFLTYVKEFRKGFAELLTSTTCEWLMAFSFIFFFFTYVTEFRKVRFCLSVNPLVNHFDEDIGPRQLQDENSRIISS